MTEPAHDRMLVEQLLRGAALSPTDEETELFVAMYPMLRAKADRIYEIEPGETGW